MRIPRDRLVSLPAAALLLAAAATSAGCLDFLNPQPQTAEAFCATLPNAGFGNLFYCGTPQTNLQGGLPNGWTGFCMTADTNAVSLTGYSTVTYAGGAFPVTTFSQAQQQCTLIDSAGLRQCAGIIRCTRE